MFRQTIELLLPGFQSPNRKDIGGPLFEKNHETLTAVIGQRSMAGMISTTHQLLLPVCKLFVNRGIKHDFPFINIRKVLREVLKTEGVARGFQPSRGTMRMLMNDKIMFDRYYCLNSAKHYENEENIGVLYFITLSHFPTRVRF